MIAIRPLTLMIVAALAAGCATQPVDVQVVAPRVGDHTVLRTRAIDRALEERILALDPERVSAQDVAEVLAKAPAPRIMLIHGGVYPVHLAMNSFGTFLTSMGYPDARIRDPASGEWSYSPYTSTRRLAGIIAWQYEQDGMRPMIVGHSQGGLYAVKVLKELAGTYAPTLPVWNPVTDQPEERTAIVDPLTGKERPAVGISASYVAVLGAGGWALVLPNQWDDFANLRKIPDTVDEFTGYFIELDLFALSFPGNPLDVPYQRNGGAAKVRNVTLPAATNHVFVPVTHELPADASVRRWIDEYTPARLSDPIPPAVGSNGLWAADVWYSIKKHWVVELQRLVRSRRAVLAGG